MKFVRENDPNDPLTLDNLLKKMTKEVIETLFEAEIEEVLGYEKNKRKNRPSKIEKMEIAEDRDEDWKGSEESKGTKETYENTNNRRNGYIEKTVDSKFGKIRLKRPRDREGTYTPIVVKNRQKDIGGMEEKILSLFAHGMSVRDIQEFIEDTYGIDFSPQTISNITDKVTEHVKRWRSRPLEPIYSIVYMDAIFYKIRKDATVKNLPVYAIIGITLEGKRDILGLWIGEDEKGESARFWLNILNELKNRGVKDVLIFTVDGISHIEDAIKTAFPNAQVQRCIVHQVRNSLRFVSNKDRKDVAADLKKIYTAPTEEAGLMRLGEFEEKWNNKYPNISRSWNRNWEYLSTLYRYPQEIRRLIYTTNPIENFNRGLRKVTKTKGVFPTDESVYKLLYLAIVNIERRWNDRRVNNWHIIYPQLYIYFEDRIKPYIKE
jgi:transposase-like protein